MRHETINFQTGEKTVVVVPDPPLADVKSELKRQVDAEAEQQRLRYITPGDGQALTYKEKKTEADRYVMTSGAGDYPFLDAMVRAGRAADRAGAASIVHQAEAAWAVIGAAIEENRERANLAISAATTVDAAHEAARVDWGGA